MVKVVLKVPVVQEVPEIVILVGEMRSLAAAVAVEAALRNPAAKTLSILKGRNPETAK